VSGARVFRSRGEEVRARMAAEEAALKAAFRGRRGRWWRRLRDLAYLAPVWLRVRLLRAVRSHPPSRGAIAPHSATGAAVQGR